MKYPSRVNGFLTPKFLTRLVLGATAAWALLDIVLVLTGHPLLRGGQLTWLAAVIFLAAFGLLATVG